MDRLTDLHYVGTNKAIVGMDTHGVWQTYTSGAVYDELASGKHGHIKPWVDVPAAPEPTVLDAVTFWERITEAEGVAIEAMLAQQPFRVRQIFMT
ncbi:hypothetical protein HBA92_22315, partial [Ochrobactrum sp. MR28]|nr:hypothetical protein [Ochrobactrum sp. MR28]MBX8819052.1 hypothetical protein [Ochrobactrum sp. MR31]